MRQLNTIIVDDDENSLSLLSDYCCGLPYVDVAGRFQSPTKFIELMPALNFDLCVIDLNLPVINGLKIAQQLKNTPIIFVAEGERMLKAALDLSPVDIVIKPYRKERLDIAFSKAYQLYGERGIVRKIAISDKKEHELFNIEGIKGKFKLKLADIVFVYTDPTDSRHKHILMKDGAAYKIRDCSFDKLLTLTSHLVRANGSQMVSLELVQNYMHNKVLLNTCVGKEQLQEVTLNQRFRKDFRERMTAWL